MILVSNRLPVTIDSMNGNLTVRPSAGGLVTALVPIIREQGGSWVGFTGTDYDSRLTGVLNNWHATHNYSLHPVFMSSSERECFYNGFSNQIIWPLFHGLASGCHYDSAYWHSYRNGNGKFAQAVQSIWRNGDFVWVQDYHLMLVGEALRRRGFGNRISYFHHIPFPTPDVFEALPWRMELLFGLMHYDVIGFQTLRDVRNFIASLLRFLPDTHITHLGKNLLVETRGLSATIGQYPVSIDFDEFDAADSPVTRATAAAIAQVAAGMKVVVGVDRLDYTKGILQRLRGFRRLLETHRESRGRITMFQVVIPSREDIPEYKKLKINIEMLISEINGEYSTPGWTPIHYFYRSVPRDELLGYYRAAHIALVTPLRDGMNLVAKEFCAARADDLGVLVLSEFAGAAEELSNGALLVNPNDTDAIAACLYSALTMSEAEQERRMKMMRFAVRTNDVFHWARSFAGDTVAVAAEPPLATSRMAGD